MPCLLDQSPFSNFGASDSFVLDSLSVMDLKTEESVENTGKWVFLVNVRVYVRAMPG